MRTTMIQHGRTKTVRIRVVLRGASSRHRAPTRQLHQVHAGVAPTSTQGDASGIAESETSCRMTCTELESTRAPKRLFGLRGARLHRHSAPSLRTIQHAQGSSDPTSERAYRTPGKEVVRGSQGEFPYGPEVTAPCGDRDSRAAMKSSMEITPFRPTAPRTRQARLQSPSRSPKPLPDWSC
jgi:hypothetical protein